MKFHSNLLNFLRFSFFLFFSPNWFSLLLKLNLSKFYIFPPGCPCERHVKRNSLESHACSANCGWESFSAKNNDEWRNPPPHPITAPSLSISVSVPVVSLNVADKIRFVSFNDANVDGKLKEEKCVSLVLLLGTQNRSQPLNQTSMRAKKKSCPHPEL